METTTRHPELTHIQYDFERIVGYDSDREYREELMRTFRIPIPPSVFGPAPPETNEPLTYSESNMIEVNFDAITNTVSQIADITKTDPCMRTLYEKAAARLLSTEIETGAILLFSYTAFHVFHICLHVYFYHRDDWGENHSAFKELMRRMSKPTRRV